jgi:flagellar protein FlaG|tara:strand:+ start:686 stop:1114 length:429 start_codon:yes stop_codon:yes gene_type:complete
MILANNVNSSGNLTNSTSVELVNAKSGQADSDIKNTENLQRNNSTKVSDNAEAQKNAPVSDVKKSEAMTPDQLEKVAQQLQEFMGEMNRSLEFLVDKDSGRDVIKVLDKGTGELLKQYPSEEVLTMISKLSDVTGNLIDTEI